IEYMTAVEFKVRSASTAAASFAVIFERIKLGMAMAAIIKMMVTTISNSIREKPFRFVLRALMFPPVPVRNVSRGTVREEHKSQLFRTQKQVNSGLPNYIWRRAILHRKCENRFTSKMPFLALFAHSLSWFGYD